MSLPGAIPGEHRLRHHRIGAAGAGEAGRLGKAPELDRDVAGPLDLVDAVGDGGVADVGLIGRVVEEDGLMLLRVGDPGGELRPGGDGAGGVVRETEVDEVGGDGRDRRDVAIGRGAVQVGHPFIATVDIGARPPGHDVGVDVDGIYRIGDRQAGVAGEDFLDVAAVALGPVRDEDLVGLDPAAAGGVVVLSHRLAEEGIPLLRPVALEGGALGHLVGRGVERLDAHGRQGLRDVADPEADHGLLRVGRDIGVHPAGDVGEQIRGLELEVVFVDPDHARKGGIGDRGRRNKPGGDV